MWKVKISQYPMQCLLFSFINPRIISAMRDPSPQLFVINIDAVVKPGLASIVSMGVKMFQQNGTFVRFHAIFRPHSWSYVAKF